MADIRDLDSSIENLCTIDGDIQHDLNNGTNEYLSSSNEKLAENTQTSDFLESLDESLLTNALNVSQIIGRLSPEVSNYEETVTSESFEGVEHSIDNEEVITSPSTHNFISHDTTERLSQNEQDTAESFNNAKRISNSENVEETSFFPLETLPVSEGVSTLSLGTTAELNNKAIYTDSFESVEKLAENGLKGNYSKLNKRKPTPTCDIIGTSFTVTNNSRNRSKPRQINNKSSVKQDLTDSFVESQPVRETKKRTRRSDHCAGSPSINNQDEELMSYTPSPKSLFTLCIEMLHNCMYNKNNIYFSGKIDKETQYNAIRKRFSKALSVEETSVCTTIEMYHSNHSSNTVTDYYEKSKGNMNALSLNQICYYKLLSLFYNNNRKIERCGQSQNKSFPQEDNMDTYCSDHINGKTTYLERKIPEKNVSLFESVCDKNLVELNKCGTNLHEDFIHTNSSDLHHDNFINSNSFHNKTVDTNSLSLKHICYEKVLELIYNKLKTKSLTAEIIVRPQNFCPRKFNKSAECFGNATNKYVKSLKILSLDTIRNQMINETIKISTIDNEKCTSPIQLNTPNSLMLIAYQNIKSLFYKNILEKTSPVLLDTLLEPKYFESPLHRFEAKCLKTLSLEKIVSLMYAENHTIFTTSSDRFFLQIHTNDFTDDLEEELDNEENYCDYNNIEEEVDPSDYQCEFEDGSDLDSNLETETQLVESKPCLTPIIQNVRSAKDNVVNYESCSAQIKLEPETEFELEHPEATETLITLKLEEVDRESDAVSVSLVTKRELIDAENATERNVQDPIGSSDIHSAAYELDAFENFISIHKPFSQSELRVRRQFEPDSDDENDNNMSLLVPHGSHPKVVVSAKNDLMESDSSDNEKRTESKTNTNNPIKNKRGRPKKIVGSKEISKDIGRKERPVNKELQILTRRMRERIRHEEKQNVSSDSDPDILNSVDTRKTKKSEKQSDKSIIGIQCNNVDSTQNISENIDKPTNETETFSGFSATDLNVISHYHDYMQSAYEKILPKISAEIEDLQNEELLQKTTDNELSDNRTKSPLLISNDPVEMLNCEPTLPIFDDPDENIPIVKKKNRIVKDKPKPSDNEPEINKYIVKDGWNCYPITDNDSKLYENCSVVMDKLPETFVETYFNYMKLKEYDKDKDEHDVEINRLTNLQSLNRIPNVKEGKVKSDNIKVKLAKKTTDAVEKEQVLTNIPSPAGSINNDELAELTPSEDEAEHPEVLPPLPNSAEISQNGLAKDLLMNDSDSNDKNANELDAEGKTIGKGDESEKKEGKEKTKDDNIRSTRKKHDKKIKTESVEIKTEGPLELTANKTLVKELDLLHAPVVLGTDENITTENKTLIKSVKPSSKRKTPHGKIKADDSSSEEEKMWVNTKEKLFKRMEKKILESNSVDEAKRAKIVKEFIEKHSDKMPSTKIRGRSRRSRKRFLEEQKQFRVLTNELFKDTFSLGDATSLIMGTSKKQSYGYAKGRRNIRKVLDKKSLAKSTLLANKDEFDRKRRLVMTHNRLRELLGLEESVKAVVINDELCLQYDFNELQPVVSVHPFFTRVMKAHQCEGVKFMWDACFESVEMVESGHRGGGCILAHCMGLGKTLQVLALLHTVLTHPRLGVGRVLVVCPLSTGLNWVDEINKWLGPVDSTIKVFELSKLKKIYERAYQLEDWYKGGGILIIGYELFRSLTTLDPFFDKVKPTIIRKIRTALLDPGPDVIVCDEGHLLKNDCSILAVAMSRVLTKRRIILTGTPMQNNLREYYCMVNFVKPNLLGKYSEYSNRFENPIINGQHRDSSDADIKLMMARTHILHKVLEGCLQRQEVSVLYPYLPAKHEYTVFIALTKCQADLYKHYLENFAKNSKQSLLKDFHMLQKIWSHPQVLHNLQNKQREENAKRIKEESLEDDLAHEDLTASEDLKPPQTEVWWLQYLDGGCMLDALESSNKFVTVFKIIDECVQLDDKLLIFSTSLYTMDSLEFFLKKIKKWNLGTEYYRLDGSVPPEVRQKWCREFNAENNHKTKLFLISTRAGSLGLNMTAANRVIILDTSWNPAHDIQSIFRVYRFGQKKDCYIYRLVAMGTMEQKMYERAVTKQAVACRVVDEQQIDRHYNMTELAELYSFDELGECVASGVALGVRDIALLRVARDTPALHAVHEHDSLLRHTAGMELPEHERAAAWDQFQQEQAHSHMQTELLERSQQLALKRSMNIISAPVFPTVSSGMQVELSDTSRITLPMQLVKNTDKSLPRIENPNLDGTPEIKTEVYEDKKDPEYLPPDAKRRKSKRLNETIISNHIPKPTGANTPKKTETSPPLDLDNPQTQDLVKGISDIFSEHNLNAHPSQINNLAKDVSEVLKQRSSVSPEIIAKKIAKLFKAYHRDSDIASDEETQATENESEIHTEQPPDKDVTKDTDDQTTNQQLNIMTMGNNIPVTESTNTFTTLRNTQPCLTDMELKIPKIKLKKLFLLDKEGVQQHIGKKVIADMKSKLKLRLSKTGVIANKDQQKIVNAEDVSKQNVPAASSSQASYTIILSDDDTVDNDTNPPINNKSNSTKIRRDKSKTGRKSQRRDTSLHGDTPQREDTSQPRDTSLREDTSQPGNDAKNTEEETVPLHPDILKNPNFVKLVAHVYEKGNTMLDEDAALRAAEYSTSKAYDEYTKQNKILASGPLHQIAVELLGKKSMKALWNSVKRDDPPKIADTPSTAPEKRKSEPIKVYSAPTNPERNPPVIPVGIMKSVANILEDQNSNRPYVPANEECIIPDNVIPVTPSLPHTPAPQTSTFSNIPSNKIVLPASVLTSAQTTNASLFLNDKLEIVTENVNTNQSGKAFVLRRVTDPKTIQNLIKLTPEINKPNARGFTDIKSTPSKTIPHPVNTNIISDSGDTICLDSDEETESQPPPLTPLKKSSTTPPQIHILRQTPNWQNTRPSTSTIQPNVRAQAPNIAISQQAIQIPTQSNTPTTVSKITQSQQNVSQNVAKQFPSNIPSQMPNATQTRPNQPQAPNIINFKQLNQSKNPNNFTPLITLVPAANRKNLQPNQQLFIASQVPNSNIILIPNSASDVGPSNAQNMTPLFIRANAPASTNVTQSTNMKTSVYPTLQMPLHAQINRSYEPPDDMIQVIDDPSSPVHMPFPHSTAENTEEFITPDIITPMINTPSTPISNITTTHSQASNVSVSNQNATSTPKPIMHNTSVSESNAKTPTYNAPTTKTSNIPIVNTPTIKTSTITTPMTKTSNLLKHALTTKDTARVHDRDLQNRLNVLKDNTSSATAVSNINSTINSDNNFQNVSSLGNDPINEDPYDSLFKNIVHIEADAYEKKGHTKPQPLPAKPKIQQNTMKSQPTAGPSKDIVKNTDVKQTVTIPKKKTDTKKSSLNTGNYKKTIDSLLAKSNNSSTKSTTVTDVVDLTDIDVSVKSTPNGTKSSTAKDKQTKNQSKQTNSTKPKGSILDTVDLTDLDEVVLTEKQTSVKPTTTKSIPKPKPKPPPPKSVINRKERIARILERKVFRPDTKKKSEITTRNSITTTQNTEKSMIKPETVTKKQEISMTTTKPEATVTGTSKTLMFKDKTLVSTDSKPSISSSSSSIASAPKVIQIKKIYSSSTTHDSNKRKTSSADFSLESSSKKKKTQFKSLEDFSFDDFEDIIELE